MQPKLLDLLEQDIYTDAHEYADRVTEVKDTVRRIRQAIASESLIEEARAQYQNDDVEIDDFGVETSRSEVEWEESTGTWVQAWVWIADADLPQKSSA